MTRHAIPDKSDKLDLRAASADLHKVAEKLQLAFEASQMGVWEFDEATGQVHWDDRMLEIYGIEDGKNIRPDDFWESHLHPDDLESTLAYAEKCKAENTDFRRDYRILREDGGIRHIRSLARSVVSPGQPSRLIGVNIDVTKDYLRAEELQKAQHQLKYDARHDALTGLGNRRGLDEMTRALFNRLSATDEYCVMHVDLDHFKQVNDRLGHLAGDHVLVSIAAALVRVIGRLGTTFRVGGDEFAVLFEKAPTEEKIIALCEALVRACAAPLSFGGQDCTVSASIGYAVGKGPPRNPSEVFINADAALYAAKKDGRSGYKGYHADMAASAPAMIREQRGDIFKADELVCYYQPQFDARTLDIVGAEALVRWHCPKRGVLAPDAFLPQAARAGLLHEVDARVFDIVAGQQTAWCEAGITFPIVSVNTSPARLRAPGLLAMARAALERHHRISLELLETAFLDTIDDALAMTLTGLRDLGLRIELDDFGSGHSSVAALQTIQPDQVKIDRSLIAPLESNPRQVETLQSLSRIARLAGANVAIEGLESGLQLAAIRDVDCDVLQGYTLQRPMPADAFTAVLARAQDGLSQRRA
ncbi:putative bifunctional diguanylate cyclase/phosphodiesterase [Gymnodinialimonas sp.]